MFAKKLSLKVLAILGISLAAGFSLMGIIAAKVQFDSLMAMQEQNSRNTAAIVIKGVQEYMLRGDAKEVAIVKLTRAAKRNALNDALILAIRNAFDNMPSTVRAAVIDGDLKAVALVPGVIDSIEVIDAAVGDAGAGGAGDPDG